MEEKNNIVDKLQKTRRKRKIILKVVIGFVFIAIIIAFWLVIYSYNRLLKKQ